MRMFQKAIHFAALSFVALTSFANASAALGQDAISPESTAPTTIVALRNGGTLVGDATYLGDHYLIRLRNGGEISLKRDEVEFVCRDLSEVYLFKQRKLDRKDIGQRLDLAEWCLRHSLYSRAASELMEATNLDPQNRRVASVERRLQLAVRPPPAPSSFATARRQTINMHEIEAEIAELDPSVVKHFRSSVQPLLLNRCEKCHGVSADNEFRLLRPLKGQVVTRRTTQRNLHAALQLLDRTDPKSSQLVAFATRPHGDGEAVLGEHSKDQIKILVHWATMVSRGPNTDRPSTIQRPDLSLLQNNEGRESPTRQRTPADRSPSRGSRSPVSPAAGDPFNPDEFNQRYSSPRLNVPSDSASKN